MKALILGARGRFGRAASVAFKEAGWQVAEAVRQPSATYPERIACDAFDPAQVTQAAEGFDVIVNAVNPPYPAWRRDLPRITDSVIRAAKATGSRVLIPGNVYSFGESMPERLFESTPQRPSTVKGELRREMEQAYRHAGVETLIVRAGDFIDTAESGNWFESHIAKRAREGVVMYPGPLDRVHAWAFLPDLARAAVELLHTPEKLDTFEVFHFEGYSLTGAELVAALERVVGKTLKVKSMPWPVIRLAGLFNPMLREIAEMRYLWQVPHRLDETRLRSRSPAFQITPLDRALALSVGRRPDLMDPEPSPVAS